MPANLVEMINGRIGSEFDGEAHFSEAEARSIAVEIERLEADLARQPQFEGVAKSKLDDLTSPERGWTICGYAIEKNGEYGLVTTGSFVGWWTVASNNAESAEALCDKLAEALRPFAAEADARAKLALGPDMDDWPIGGSSLTLGDLRRAREALEQVGKR